MLARLLSLSKQAAMSANTRGKDVNQRVRPKETAAAKTAKAAGKKAANKRKDAAARKTGCSVQRPLMPASSDSSSRAQRYTS